MLLLFFFLYYFKRAALNRQNDRHWSSTTDVSFQVFCERKSNTNITTHFPPAYNTICNSRCAFYFSEVLKLCTDYVTRRGKVNVKWSLYRPGVAQRVGRGIALLFFDRGTRRGWVVSLTPRPHLTPGKDPGPILQKAGWAPGPVWTGGSLVPTGIRSRTVHPVVSRLMNEYVIKSTISAKCCCIIFRS